MNGLLKELLDKSGPKIANLSDEEKKHYRLGLNILRVVASENFFDIPKLPDHKYSQNGRFYSIPYFDDETLWAMGSTRMLLVVYKIENRSSFCPMSMDIQTVDKNNFKIIVNDQSGERTIKHTLISCEDGNFFTGIDGYDKITLSEMLNLEVNKHDLL